MLDKLSNQILDFMLSYSDTPAKICYNFQEDLDDMAKAFSSDRETVSAALLYLRDSGYIKYEYSHGVLICFYLDHKGLHKREMDKKRRLDFIKRNILTPILVSFLTAALTTSLWPSLLHWLKMMLSQIQ